MNRISNELEKNLWDAADQFRANSNLTAAEYSMPVLGLIFLRYADIKFSEAEKIQEEKKKNAKNDRAMDSSAADYHAAGVMYLPKEARYLYLLNLPESENVGQAINNAMKAVEEHNPDLKGILPKTYTRFNNDLLVNLLKNFSESLKNVEGDVFGKIYEYFLSNFAMKEGQGGGEFFTPTAIVKLIVEIMEPYKGMILDPACGSGGMFVQSSNFVEEHKTNGSVLSCYGQEKTEATIKLAKMNLAVHGLSGTIKQGNTIYEDIHNSIGKFDFVMANPPFNLKNVDKEKIKDDPRYSYGLPSTDNGNYLWIQIFLNALNEKGRAGFVMANSASDAGHSEMEIRKKMIEDGVVDVMVAIGSNFFYTVTLACTLWFLDNGKKNTDRKDKVLFIDARNIYNQIDRAHRDFTPEQIQDIAKIVKSYRAEEGVKKYQDVAGLCRVVSIKEIKEQGYSLNPGRYVGVAEKEADTEDFGEKIKGLTNEFEELTKEARGLEEKILENVKKII
jgi:type I restriction enzyme M protein